MKSQKMTIQLIMPVDEHSKPMARAATRYYKKKGFEVIDPHEVPNMIDEDLGTSEAKIQAARLFSLAISDVAIIMPGWKRNQECVNEVTFATANGIPLYYYKSNMQVYFNSHIIVRQESQRPGDIFTADDLYGGDFVTDQQGNKHPILKGGRS